MKDVADAGDPPGEVLVCRLSLPLPRGSYCYGLTLSHPELRFEVQGIIPTLRNEMVENLRVDGMSEPEALLKEMKGFPDIMSIERVHSSKGGFVLSLKLPRCPIIALHQQLDMVPNFPFAIEGGKMSVLVVAPAVKVRALYAGLRKSYPGTEIVSIRRNRVDGKNTLLTSHQLEIFRYAMSSGYWDVPRRTTMTKIAQAINVSKSSVSETLATIENKLLHEVGDSYLSQI